MPSLLLFNIVDVCSFICMYPPLSNSPEVKHAFIHQYQFTRKNATLYLRTYNSASNKVMTKVSMIPINKIFTLNNIFLNFFLKLRFLRNENHNYSIIRIE